MLSFDQMPEDNEDLANVEIDFPRLPDDTAESSPVPISELIDYLRIEVPVPDSFTAADLRFLRTAEIYGEAFYWIWEFRDPEGAKCYATVSEHPETFATCLGCGEDYYGLTPEQYLLGDYHNVF